MPDLLLRMADKIATMSEHLTRIAERKRRMTIVDLIQQSHATALEKGWWERDHSFPEQLALVHSEVSETLEDYRVHGMNPETFIFIEQTGKPSGLAVEIADVFIRLCDSCGRYGIPLEDALRAKLEWNKSRPHRHGGKLA